MNNRFFPVGVLTLLLCGCAPKKIPGTDLDDTSDTRAVIDVLQKYRSAVEQKNTDALMTMVDESFRDDGGTSSPDDDTDFGSLPAKVSARFSKVVDLRLEVTIKRIEFDTENQVARVTYSYRLNFKMPEYSSRNQGENDLKQMLLKRVSGEHWKITSGI
jgi:hypothetical protein